eukprot:5505087-Pleurochrysis_carterae.AAC.2
MSAGRLTALYSTLGGDVWAGDSTTNEVRDCDAPPQPWSVSHAFRVLSRKESEGARMCAAAEALGPGGEGARTAAGASEGANGLGAGMRVSARQCASMRARARASRVHHGSVRAVLLRPLRSAAP